MPPNHRLLSLDVFRGITMMVMIIVNSPGNETSFSILEHSAWNGCTLADLVFPFFVFIVGVSSVLTIEKQQAEGISFGLLLGKIGRRTLLLFLIGVLLNAVSLQVDWSTLRLLGVLQRIAICYGISSVLYVTTSIRMQALIAGFLLLGYWMIMSVSQGSNPFTMTGNVAAYLDRVLISPAHMYTHDYEPEGLLSTLPAIATALLGNLVGAWLCLPYASSKKCAGLVMAGVICSIIGWYWGDVFPINKTLWTSSYVAWTGGMALLTFAGFYWLLEMKGCKNWSKPFQIFGASALSVYILHVLFLKIQAMILISVPGAASVNVRVFLTQTIFPSFERKTASLLYAMSYMLCWLVIMLCSVRKVRTSHGA